MYALLIRALAAIPLGTLVAADSEFARAKTYQLKDMYQGQSFFSDWYFFMGSDPTNGNVNYLDQNDAQSQGLAYVTDNNVFVMAVDSTTDVPAGGQRNSVRIQSSNSYTGGLFILDAAAMPIGCAVWPSFWTNGPNWPTSGEIDIVEGINNQPRNQMTLHSGTSNPCTINQTSGKSTYTGQLLNRNCYSTQTSDSGCSILDPSTQSFGPGFNAAGGGVFALLWDASYAMAMWHFPRQSIPADITNQNPNPAGWGTPAGFWSAKTCDIADNFQDHTLIFDVTVCGGWAAGAYSQSGCPGTCSQMVANTTNFANAKWMVNYVAVYQ